MPPARESLQSVKRRLAREQKTRTDRRVRALLQPNLTRQEPKIYDDSEEENRISGRRARGNRDQTTQTNSSYSSFFCGVVVGVFVVAFCCLALSFSAQMTDRAWQSKGKKLPRKSPRRRGKTCGRPFKAPRPIAELENSDVQYISQDRDDNHDSQVQIITETENEPHVIPFIPDIKMMSERENNEMAREGEVLRWSNQ
jgi:hypothetical protein